MFRGEPDRRHPQAPPQPQSVLGRDETPFFGDRTPQAGQRPQTRKTPSPTDHRDPGESRRRHSGPTETTPTASRRRLKTAQRDPPAPPRQTAPMCQSPRLLRRSPTRRTPPTIPQARCSALRRMAFFSASPSFSFLRSAEEWRLDFTQRRV